MAYNIQNPCSSQKQPIADTYLPLLQTVYAYSATISLRDISMKTFFKFVGFLILILIIVVILLLGYLGFVPGVSAIFGSNKPRDLGITHTQADLDSAQTKLGQKK